MAGDGTVILAGDVEDLSAAPVILDPGGPGQVSLVPRGRDDFFLAGYAGDDGRLLWHKHESGSTNTTDLSPEHPIGVLARPAGEVLVAGRYSSTAAPFGRGDPGETVISAGATNRSGSFRKNVRGDGAGWSVSMTSRVTPPTSLSVTFSIEISCA